MIPRYWRVVGQGTGCSWLLLAVMLGSSIAATPASVHAAESYVTWLDQRFAGVVAQTTEYSCGAAAVAGLLSVFYGIPATESEVLGIIEELVRVRGEEPRDRGGLTAYDLKESAILLGLHTAGYRLNSRQVEDYFARGGLPAIAHVTKPRPHYLVVVGVTDGLMMLADPGWGRYVTTISGLAEDRKMSGIFIVAVPTEEQARHAREEQRRALDWMCLRASRLSELRECILP